MVGAIRSRSFREATLFNRINDFNSHLNKYTTMVTFLKVTRTSITFSKAASTLLNINKDTRITFLEDSNDLLLYVDTAPYGYKVNVKDKIYYRVNSRKLCRWLLKFIGNERAEIKNIDKKTYKISNAAT